MSDRTRFGGDYNPEQWPRPVWDEDVRLMGEAGVDLVTVGVFSWAELEPEEGVFSFGWLRELLDLLGDAGIGVDLATPTASPPPWLSTHHPDVLPVNAAGAVYTHGSRQHFCVCSPTYRAMAGRIVERLADEVGSHPAVEMWHLSNEYACHVPYCYCDHHAKAFRVWLERRYGSVDGLNGAWGTAFWSQRYGDFAEVMPPRMTPTFGNPAQDLDYRRFSSDAFLEEAREERAVLKKCRPELPVTTNFMGFFKPLDYFAWAAELDLASTDNYTDPSDPEWSMQSAMHYDLIRSVNKEIPWMVMEQTSSRVNWRPHNAAKVPGQMRAMSYQAVARGATGVLFFQWRASRSGAEKFHSAMLSHSGVTSPVWSEVSALGQELARLGSFDGARVEADVALIFSWPNWWAVEAPSKPANDLRMDEMLTWLYRPLYKRGITVDFCRPDEPLERYQAIVVPSLYLVSEQEAANLVSYVERGGTAVVSFWSGIVDPTDTVYLGPYGGPLRPLIGCDVLEVSPLPAGETVEVEWEDGERTAATFWADVAAEGEGRVIARIADGPWAGRPAVVETVRGQGRAYYLAARLDAAGLDRVYARVAVFSKRQGLAPMPGVERVVRAADGQMYEFLINCSEEDKHVEVAAAGLDLLTGRRVEGKLVLPPMGVAIIRQSEDQ
ncbi:MAG TPA: beta-galactosidase [Acidimicrobiales bacterium]|nr:beta-galactosidase [Acidimicrobiales bacterium]